MATVNGVFKLTSPFHQAAPGSARFDPNKGDSPFYASGAAKGSSAPCTTTMKMKVMRNLTEIEEGAAPVTTDRIPIMTANSVRGLLRRCAAKMIFDKLSDKISVDTYHVLKCGAASGSPDKSDPTIHEAIALRDHFYIGLFGGGPKLMPSQLRVDSLLPINDITLENELVPAEFEDYKNAIKSTQVLMFRRVDDALVFQCDYAPKIIDDYSNALEEWRATIAPKKEGEDSPRGVRSWSSMEIICPGVNMAFHAGCESDDEAKLGLFFKMIELFCNRQKIGGWTRNHYGTFSVQLMTLELDGKKIELFKKLGTKVELNDNDPIIKSCLAALDEALENDLNIEQLEKFCAPEAK